MRINQMEQVITIAREGSFSQAAKKLFISQPNLSASVRDLEKELGSKLFRRVGKGVELTPFGSDFLAYAEPVIQYYGNLRAFCFDSDGTEVKRLTVASQHFRFASLLFGKYCGECESSSYEFSFLEGTEEDVKKLVRNQEADFGLIAQTVSQRKANSVSYEKSGLLYTPLKRQKLSVILRKDHPLCRNAEGIGRRQLKDYPLVLYRDTNFQNSDFVNQVLNLSGKRKIMVNERASLHEILELTDAFTIGAYNSSAFKNNPYYTGLVAIPLSDWNPELEIGYLVSRSRPLSEPAREYLDRLRETLELTRN